MSSKMLGMGNRDGSQGDEHVAKENQINRKNKWQSQPSRHGQHSVTFLSGAWDDEYIQEKFSECGHVTDIHKSHNRTFVRYNTEDEAKAAEEMHKEEFGASIAIKKDKKQKTADGGKTPQIPVGLNEKIEVRVLRLDKSASEEDACQEILGSANYVSYRFRFAQNCNMLYVDFSTREDAQKFIDDWHQKEWRADKLSVHFVEKKVNQGNSESRGKKKGERQFGGQNRRMLEQESREDVAGDVPRKETWEDNEPETTLSDFIYPSKGNTKTFSSAMDRNNNSNKTSGGKKWEQQESVSQDTMHLNVYNGDDQGREQGDPRSSKNGVFFNGGDPWRNSDSIITLKNSNFMSKHGRGGSQDARLLVKNQEQNGSRGNSLPNGGFKNRPREQAETPLGENESPWKRHSTPSNQQGRRGHNGPSPRKLPDLRRYSDEVDMPPLENMSLDKEDPALWRSDSPPMPALEAMGFNASIAMPPLEMAALKPLGSPPLTIQAAALPDCKDQIEGLILSNLPSDGKEVVVRALLRQYKLTEVNMFSKRGAFVKFNSEEEAKRACEELDNLLFQGDRLSAKLQYMKSSNRRHGGSAITGANKHQGTQGKNPLQKTWEEVLEHYKVITHALNMSPKPPQANETRHVRITYISGADCFWAQDISSEDDRRRLVALSNLERSIPESHLLQQATGGRCCAPYETQGRQVYYRAWMLCPPAFSNYLVFFVDYGNVEVVPKATVKKLDSEFWKLPGLAMPFKLREGTTKTLKENEEIHLEIHAVDEKMHLATCSLCN